MKISIFKSSWRGRNQAARARCSSGFVGVSALLLTTASLLANPHIQTITGGPSQFYPATPYGYADGSTAAAAKFNFPAGIAFDPAGNALFVADYSNNMVRVVADLSDPTLSLTSTFAGTNDGIAHPVAVAVDGATNVYVLNQGNGANGSVLKIPGSYYYDYGDSNVLASNLVNATALALDWSTNLYVTVSNNTVLQITPTNTPAHPFQVVGVVTNAGVSLRGVTVVNSGELALSDAGSNGIWLLDLTNHNVTDNATHLTGFNGAGDDNTTNGLVVPKQFARFNDPEMIATAGGNMLVVADRGNNKIKIVNADSGEVSRLYGVNSNYWVNGSAQNGIFPGWYDGDVCSMDMLGCPEARQPLGVAVASDGSVYTTEVYYHIIRHATSTGLLPPPPPPPGAPVILSVSTNYGQVTLTWSASVGATNYFVKRGSLTGGPYTTIASVTGTSYTDTNVINGTTYYYVVSASNASGEGPNSGEVSATPPLPPVPDPQIGYVDFPATSSPVSYTSVFHPGNSFVFNNDVPIVVLSAAGAQTYYEWTNTPDAASVPTPTTNSASAPVGYQDGMTPGQVSAFMVAQIAPYVNIKAISAKNDGSPNSQVVHATIQFVTGNPIINGNNAANFTITDVSDGAQLWYTTDGSDPTDAAPSHLGGTISGTNGITLSLPQPTGSNMTFKVRGFKANYQPSAVVTTTFSTNDFVPNSITFGFASGEASSDFVGAPGQYFYAPVTMSVLKGVQIYSLQFNLTATNGGPNPGPAITPVAFSFTSFLEKPIPGTKPVVYEQIPPLMFSAYAADPPPPGQIVNYDGLPFVNMTFTNSSANLLGVGWLERLTQTNLYDTTKQDLIAYSQPHDTIFLEAGGKVVVGGYAFRIPSGAKAGDTYQIQIGRPSATSDGIGAPGSSVYIATPTNGPVSSVKIVTAGQRKYIVGDSAPFKWFNAGDFGNTNLDNSDVMQVFEAAVYSFDMPPLGSDFFDSMKSSGAFGVWDPSSGYFTNAGPLNAAQKNLLFDGNDTNINQIVFGDDSKPLDVADVYVTFRRSLDPSLLWFRRFWTNGVRVAEVVGNQFNPLSLPKTITKSGLAPIVDQPTVSFGAGDSIATPGQTVQIPITAQIFGSYPVRILMLNLSVEPLDGSPSLDSAIEFAPNPALGQPTIASSTGNNNYAAAWLNSQISGLTSNAVVGTLTITVPAGASSSAAYAVHFDHVSASPNGLATFADHTLTGLVTLSDRSTSSYNDGIPDSWRLRYFGTVNNLLSQAAADADGDGMDNWQEYVAGTDPTDAGSCLKVTADTSAAGGQNRTIHWPSVAGKQYVIEQTSNLFDGNWTPVSTNTGTGSDMEFQDATGGAVHFYRVHVVP